MNFYLPNVPYGLGTGVTAILFFFFPFKLSSNHVEQIVSSHLVDKKTENRSS